MLTEGALANWTSSYLHQALAVSGGFALGYFAFSIGMGAGRLGGDALVARRGRRSVRAGGALMANLALDAVLAHSMLLTAGFGFLFVGLGLAHIVPVTFGIAGRLGVSEAAGSAAVAQCGYAGFVVGPPVIGALAGIAGLAAALVLLAAATLWIAVAGGGLFALRWPGMPAPWRFSDPGRP